MYTVVSIADNEVVLQEEYETYIEARDVADKQAGNIETSLCECGIVLIMEVNDDKQIVIIESITVNNK